MKELEKKSKCVDLKVEVLSETKDRVMFFLSTFLDKTFGRLIKKMNKRREQ